MAINSISAYKTDIIKDLINNENIVKGIESQQKGIDTDSPDTLIYNNIWPFHKILKTQTIADTHILIDVDVLDINNKNPTYAKYRVKIRILCHVDRMKMPGYQGTRADYLYEEIKKQFDGKQKYGFSELMLRNRISDVYDESYCFVDMVFTTNDQRKPVGG